MTIGHLSQGIADASLRKDKGIQSVSLSRQLSDADAGSSAPGFCRAEDFPPDLASLWNLAFLLMLGVLFVRIQSPAGLVCKSLAAEHVSPVRGTMDCHSISRPMEPKMLSIGRAFAGKSRPLDMRNGSHQPWSIRRKWIASKSKEYIADNNFMALKDE